MQRGVGSRGHRALGVVIFFVPESEKWKAEYARGATAHWSHWDLSGVAIGSVAALAIIWAWSPAGGAFGIGVSSATAITLVGLAIAAVGYLHPVRKYLQRAQAAGTLSREHGSGLIKLMLFGAALAAV